VSLGGTSFVYDTEESRWAEAHVAVNDGRILMFLGQKRRPNLEFGHDFHDPFGNPRFSVRAGISLLLPADCR
jgi:hypothetical protein